MPIEIKELVIKTTIVERAASGDGEAAAVSQSVKDQILAECRQLVADLLRERGER
jgi:hypothetical protein